eukprot:scaffold3579_cov168-Cylindrotheca_fusiformis.AAC.4
MAAESPNSKQYTPSEKIEADEEADGEFSVNFPPPSTPEQDVDTSAFDQDNENDDDDDDEYGNFMIQPSSSTTSTSVHETESVKPDGTRVVRRETIDESGFVLDTEVREYPPAVDEEQPTTQETTPHPQEVKLHDEPEEKKDQNQDPVSSMDEEDEKGKNAAFPTTNFGEASSSSSASEALSSSKAEPDVDRNGTKEKLQQAKQDTICGLPKPLFWKVFVCIVLLLVIVAAIIGAIVANLDSEPTTTSENNENPKPPTQAPTAEPGTTSPTGPTMRPTPSPPPTRMIPEGMRTLASILMPSVDDLDAVSIFEPFYRALEWLHEDDVSGISITEDSAVLQERFAAATLYFSTNGKGWINKNNWLSANSICDWSGLDCDDTGSVTKLVFNANNLQGSIPEELGRLTQLQLLNLKQNSLTGSLPSTIGFFTNLQKLDVYSNDLVGAIPSEIGNLSDLIEMILWQNRISDAIPSEMGRLGQLTNMDFAENALEGTLPTELGGMTSLGQMYLDNNRLEGPLPSELGRLQNLAGIYARNNLLSGIVPSELGNCASLTDVTLNSNEFSGGFENLFCSRNMIQFYADCGGDNGLECSCCTHCCSDDPPGCFEPVDQIAPTASPSMAPTSNRLSTFADLLIPPADIATVVTNTSLPQHQALRWLNDRDYAADKPIVNDNELQERYALAVLYFSTNGEDWINQGSWLRPELSACSWRFVNCFGSRVQSIDLHDNNLEGSLPSELEKLFDLVSLSITANPFLVSSIPTQLGELSFLTNLELWSNNLSGQLPTELFGLTDLTALNLGDNRLTGSIPTNVFELTNLRSLDLGRNGLSGDIPPQIGYLPLLGSLSLHDNNIVGSLPTDLARLTRLGTLQLYNNYLSATIPPEIAYMTSLASLQLQDNELTGTLPSQIMTLPFIKYLRLSSNKLQGSLLSEIGSLRQLGYLNLQQNDFTGSIPSEIGQLTQLTTLSLAFTQLSGIVPSEMETMPVLKTLFLHGTNITGGLENIFCERALSFLYADCRGTTPQISCTCCNFCCNPDGFNCVNRF